MRAEQVQRTQEIEALQSRLDAIEAGLGEAPVIDADRQADIRGRGLGPAPQAAAPAITIAPQGLTVPQAAAAPVAPAPVTAAAAAPAAPAPAQAGAARPAPVQTAAAQPAAGDANAVGQPAAGDEGDVRREPAKPLSVEAVTAHEQGLFGDRLSFEAGFSYSHFDQARLNLSGFLALDAIFLGRISLDQVSGNVFSVDFTARYGITDRLQVDANVPYLHRVSTFQSGGAGGAAAGLAEATVQGSGIGDASFGASYRLFMETQTRPDIVVNVRGKVPTGRNPYGIEVVDVPGTQNNLSIPEKLGLGSGTWGASIGASALKTLDPIVVFGNVSYFRNFTKNFEDISEARGNQPGDVDQGDAYQYGAGVAFAVNERAGLSFSFTQRFVEHSKIRNAGGTWGTIVGSDANVASLNMGATFAVAERTSIVVNVGAGLTHDTPDFSLSTRVPFSF